MNDPHKPDVSSESSEPAPQWQPLDSLQRRVLGVLIEKAKTTPDAYPLTVNAIKTGSNQKSNRDPKLDLGADDVMATLDELREMGAVAELQGDGRVSKYRHLAYQWLDVDKVELAVLGELLLRGQQTVGELRSRAARMEAIAGMSELKPIMQSLKAKGLLVEVTPTGRGQVVTHNLYEEGSPAGSVAVASVAAQPSVSAEPFAKKTSDTSPSLVKMKEQFEGQIEELTEYARQLELRIDALEKSNG